MKTEKEKIIGKGKFLNCVTITFGDGEFKGKSIFVTTNSDEKADKIIIAYLQSKGYLVVDNEMKETGK